MSNRRRHPHLQLIKCDYVTESVSMLKQMDQDSLLVYALVVAAEARVYCKLPQYRYAQVMLLVSCLVKEIEKAA